jgi:hypothetical protein
MILQTQLAGMLYISSVRFLSNHVSGITQSFQYYVDCTTVKASKLTELRLFEQFHIQRLDFVMVNPERYLY